ncbi:hypothetical protein MVEN_01624800 [Mycena venus]|uniref:MYND-type domain-containing protein n=1 Tax=Mycena venus TaxID=2733690 RepID=A0A8H6XQJ2_9AGAR|nr:hypothetical protein MVEN_01624800 [Mycena venus]
MHPSLQLQRLSELPATLEERPHRAATGSVEDLQRLSSAQSAPLHPVFYVNLDPIGIPDQLDGMPFPVSRAFESIKALFGGPPIPTAAMADLWPRFWPWVQFFDLHIGYFSAPNQFGEDFPLNFVHFIWPFRDEPIFSLMTATRGVRSIIAKAWSLAVPLTINKKPRRDAALRGVFGCMLGGMNAAGPANLAEFVEGTGGSINHLASVIIALFEGLVPTPDTQVSPGECMFLRSLFVFIDTTDRITENSGRPTESYLLFSALHSQGLVRVLTTVLSAVSAIRDPSRDDGTLVVHDCFVTLSIAFRTRSAHSSLEEAVQYNLLRVMLVCGNLARVSPLLDQLLMETLPAALIYYRVVMRVDDALHRILEADLLDSSPLSRTEAWRKFVQLAKQRLQILRNLKRASWSYSKACDNLECSHLRDRHRFARCSGCKNRYYCSNSCQISDWKDGGHRKTCASGSNLSLNTSQDFNWRERAFMRAVLHANYLENRPWILKDHNSFPQRHPTEVPLVCFDYSLGSPIIRVTSATRSYHAKKFGDNTEWADMVSRAQASRGSLHLHVIAVPNGHKEVRYLSAPLRRLPTLNTAEDGSDCVEIH